MQNPSDIKKAGSPRKAPSGHLLKTLFLFYILAALLNAEGIERTVKRMKFGKSRQVLVTVVTPLADVSRMLKINLLRKTLEDMKEE